jgi:hypothetical protein
MIFLIHNFYYGRPLWVLVLGAKNLAMTLMKSTSVLLP